MKMPEDFLLILTPDFFFCGRTFWWVIDLYLILIFTSVPGKTKKSDRNSCSHQLCECDREFAMCLQKYLPCPNSKALCKSKQRLLQNIFMGVASGKGMHDPHKHKHHKPHHHKHHKPHHHKDHSPQQFIQVNVCLFVFLFIFLFFVFLLVFFIPFICLFLYFFCWCNHKNSIQSKTTSIGQELIYEVKLQTWAWPGRP